ncbi:hypothetical protein CW304_17830 [Bacillus sp. UFRGS-B20]|nr:hypothetical protein CW304_17830 [Bacillus sp. UFRGS-B20]
MLLLYFSIGVHMEKHKCKNKKRDKKLCVICFPLCQYKQRKRAYWSNMNSISSRIYQRDTCDYWEKVQFKAQS